MKIYLTHLQKKILIIFQISGKKHWTLKPTQECYWTCNYGEKISVIAEPGILKPDQKWNLYILIKLPTLMPNEQYTLASVWVEISTFEGCLEICKSAVKPLPLLCLLRYSNEKLIEIFSWGESKQQKVKVKSS